MTPEKDGAFKELVGNQISNLRSVENSVKNSIRRNTINNFVRIFTAGTILTGTVGCVAVNGAGHESGDNRPIVTLTAEPTKDPGTNTDPTQATYELTPTQKATDTMINPPTLTPEPTTNEIIETPGILTEMQEWRIFLESMKDVDNIVLAPEQFFSDFFDKKIPIQKDLRLGEDDLVKDIGVCEIEENETNSNLGHAQLLLMGGYVKDNDGLFLLVGTQAENGDRFILPVQLTFGETAPLSNSMVILDGNEIKRIVLPAVALNSMSTEQILEYVEKNLGEVIVIQFMLDEKEGVRAPQPVYVQIDEKASVTERLEVNNMFCRNPEELKINDLNDLKKIPWGQLIVFSN